MLQTIRERLKDSKTSAFVVSAWKGVGKSRIMRQLMDQIRQQPSLFDIIARVRAPGAEVLGEEMLMRIQNELNKLRSEEDTFRKTRSVTTAQENARGSRLFQLQNEHRAHIRN